MSLYQIAGQTPSTTWQYRKIRIEPDAHPQGNALRSSGHSSFFRSRSRYKRNGIVIQYRGGPEASWLVCIGERCWRFPGWLCIEDCFTQVLGQTPREDERC